MTDFYAKMFNEWDGVQAQGDSKEKFPKGVFEVVISRTELKAGRNDADALVQHIEMKVVKGQYKDQTIMDYINLVNKNERAVQIGKSRLKSYIEATGVKPKQSADEFKGIPFKIRTDHKLDSFVGNDGAVVPTVTVELKGIYSLASKVVGEELEPISSNTTLNSPEGLAFKAALKGQGGSVGTTTPNTPPSAPKAPTTPPAAPKAPPKPVAVAEDSGDGQPDWFTPDA